MPTRLRTERLLTLHPRLDGTADIAGTLDPETAAAALAAFATTAIHAPDTDDPDTRDDDPDTRDGDGDGGLSDGDRVRVARRRADVDIFGDLCRLRLTRHPHTTAAEADATDATDATGTVADPGAVAGGGGVRGCRWCGSAPSTARPALLVVADLAALDPTSPVGSGTARVHWRPAAHPSSSPPQPPGGWRATPRCGSWSPTAPSVLGVTKGAPQGLRHPARGVDGAGRRLPVPHLHPARRVVRRPPPHRRRPQRPDVPGQPRAPCAATITTPSTTAAGTPHWVTTR